MSAPELFPNQPTRPTKAAHLAAFKKQHGILTHRSPRLGQKRHHWLAVLPYDDDKGKPVAVIMARSCRLYEEDQRVATGPGELSAVRELAKLRGIPCQP